MVTEMVGPVFVIVVVVMLVVVFVAAARLGARLSNTCSLSPDIVDCALRWCLY
jgi:hypothetical protein